MQLNSNRDTLVDTAVTVYPSGSQTFLHVDPQLKYTIFSRPRGLATAELRHKHYNIVYDVTNRTIFMMSSQWMI